MSVQDPFVLDHNTTSNVSERLRSDITREFGRASTLCRSVIGCDDNVDAEHAGIVELLSDSSLSVSSPATSLQLALSPRQGVEENVAGIDTSNETTHIQLFLLRYQHLAEPDTAAATVPRHRVAEPEHRANAAVGTVSWYCGVVDKVKVMLGDIFDVHWVSLDQPSELFDHQLSRLLTARADRDRSGTVQRQQQVCKMTLDGQPPSASSVTQTDCTTSESQLCLPRKHLLPADDCDTDKEAIDSGDGGLSEQHRVRTAAKRHKTSDSTSDVVGQQSTVADKERHVLLSVNCSARSRLWIGRKKIRRRFMHFPDELKRQLEVSSALRNEITKADHTILEFELAIVRPLHRSAEELVVAVLPSQNTGKEFGCFITFFVSLLPKLVDNITVEGPIIP